jgi:hypothetical protein
MVPWPSRAQWPGHHDEHLPARHRVPVGRWHCTSSRPRISFPVQPGTESQPSAPCSGWGERRASRSGELSDEKYFEAHQIEPLVANSPFMGWLYHMLSVYTFSALLGVVELAAALLLAIKPLAPKLSIAGSLLAIVLFISTISFLFTTPGVSEAAGGGFPALSLTGEFLLKDVPLLGLSFWTLADSIRAAMLRQTAD